MDASDRAGGNPGPDTGSALTTGDASDAENPPGGGEGVSDEPAPRTVTGRVVEADDRPVAAARVQAFAVRLRDEASLGDPAITDGDGQYTITYGPRGPGDSPDLNLRVRAFSATEDELAASPVHFAAGDAEIIDLTVPQAASAVAEFERHLAELRPALGTVRLAEVTGGEIPFLTGDTGIPADRLQVLIEASRRAGTSGDEGLRPLPPEVWYAWQREGIDVADGALWDRPVDELIAAVRSAVQLGIVSAEVEEHIDELTTLVKQHRLDFLLDQPLSVSITGTSGGGVTGGVALRDLLTTLPAPLEARGQRAVAEVLIDRPYEPEPARLSRDLQQAGLTASAADAVVRAVRLADLTQGHVPLIEGLQPLAG